MSSEFGSESSDPSGAPDGGEVRREVIRAHGHESISGAHASTLEVTTDDFLTPAGDCILAVEADKAPADFDPAFVAACQDETATITMTISAGGEEATITGRGDSRLTFESERSAVGRTSDYVDERTIFVAADAAAADVDRAVVDALANGTAATVTVTVDP